MTEKTEIQARWDAQEMILAELVGKTITDAKLFIDSVELETEDSVIELLGTAWGTVRVRRID